MNGIRFDAPISLACIFLFVTYSLSAFGSPGAEGAFSVFQQLEAGRHVLNYDVSNAGVVEADGDELRLIAHFPLRESASDITGQNDDMELINTPFDDGGIYSDGNYFWNASPNHAETGVIKNFNYSYFAIEFEFKILDQEIQPVVNAGIRGWVGLEIGANGEAILLYQNSNRVISSKIIEEQQWYLAKIVYQGGVGNLFINGELVASKPFTIYIKDRSPNFMITNFGSGHTLRGWLHELKIYSKEYSGTDLISPSAIPDQAGSGHINVVAGGISGFGEGGPAILSPLTWSPSSIDVDQLGRLYFNDLKAESIRRINLDGTLTTVYDHHLPNNYGRFITDFVIADNYLYHIFGYDPSVYRLDLTTGASELVAVLEPPIGDCCGSDSLIAVDTEENIYFYTNNRIFLIDRASGKTAHFAGNGLTSFVGDNIPAIDATTNVEDMIIDPRDNSLLIAGKHGHQVSRITPATGLMNFISQDIQVPVVINYLDIDPNGDVLFGGSTRIYRYVQDSDQVLHVGGSGWYGAGGDGGPALSASINAGALTIDAKGNYYFAPAEYSNLRRIRFVDTSKDVISTVVGMPGRLSCSSPIDSLFQQARALDIDSDGLIYVRAFDAILVIDQELDRIYSLAGTYGETGFTEDGEPGFGNPLNFDRGSTDRRMTVMPNGDVFVTEVDRIRKLDAVTGLLTTVAHGKFHAVRYDNNGGLYAYKKHDQYYDYTPDFVRIDIESGDVAIFITGGDEPPVPGQSAEGKKFGNPNDLAVDRAGNLFVSISGEIAPELPSGIYRIDAETKVLTSVVNEHAYSSRQIEGGLVLDEDNGNIYYTLLRNSLSDENVPIVRVDLSNGRQTRFAGLRTHSEFINTEDPLDALIFPTDLAVTASGNLLFSNFGDFFDHVLEISPQVRDQYSLIPSDIEAGSNVGRAVAGYENWLAIGVPKGQNGVGEVLVYQDNDCRPILRDRLTAPEGTTANQFGSQVAFVGDALVVSAEASTPSSQIQANTEDESTFRIGVFGLKDGRSWGFNRDLSGLLSPVGTEAGSSLVSDDDSFVVGLPGANDGDGEVTIFDINELDNPVTLSPSDDDTIDFGKSLAMDDDLLAVGSGSTQSGGKVELFDSSGSSYQSIGSIESSADYPEFATALAMNEDALYVGSPDPSGGRVYDYTLADLSLSDTLADPDNASNPSFGEALAIEEGVLVVGAPDTDAATVQTGTSKIEASGGSSKPEIDLASGAIFAFGVKDGSSRRTRGNLLFTLLAQAAEAYGEAVDISNGRIVVGAPETDDGRGTFDSVGMIVDSSQLSGLWYDPEQDGEGYNILVAPNGMVVFFYGYDTNGERLWLISETVTGEFQFGQDVHVPIYKAVQGDFAAPKSSDEALVKYGLLSMSFGSLRSATFTINGFDGNKISRSTFLADTTANAAAFSGLWFDPSKDGEGYNIISGKHTTVIYYYGSTSEGERLWLISDGMSNDLSGGRTVTARMYEAVGGDFYHPEPSSSALSNWGTIEARFDDCDHGRFILTGGDGNKTSDVVKLAGVNGANCN